MAEQERDHTQNSSVPVLTDLGPPISNRDGPDDAENTEDESHQLSVYATDPPYRRPNTRTRLRTRRQLPAGAASSSRTSPAIPDAARR